MRFRGLRSQALVISILVAPGIPAADWLQLGGPTSDFKLADEGLAQDWPEDGPRQVWSRELGGGYSGILAQGKRLFTMFRRGSDEVVLALDAATGKTIWEHAYAAKPDPKQNLQYGSGPNATPLIVGDQIFTVGFLNKMHALDLATGKLRWSKDLTAEYGTPLLEFGYASSPIAYKNWVVVLTGGKQVGAVALDRKTGAAKWQAPAVPISYDTPQIAERDGESLLVFMAPTEVVAISMARSKVAWRYPHQNQWDTNCLGPWFGEDDLVFVSSSGDAGSRTLKLSEGTKVEEVTRNLKVKSSTGSKIRDGHIVYGASGPALLAHDIRSGAILWQQRGYKDANLLQVGRRTLLLDGAGKLGLATLTPDGARIHAEHQVLAKPSLTAPTLVGTKLYLRDQQRIVALELGSP